VLSKRLLEFIFTENTVLQAITNEAAEEEEYDSDDEDGDIIVLAEPLKQSVKLHLKHNPLRQQTDSKNSAVEFTVKDLTRIQTLHTRIIEKKNQNTISRLKKEKSVVASAALPESYPVGLKGKNCLMILCFHVYFIYTIFGVFR
jgi:hypothetical protein